MWGFVDIGGQDKVRANAELREKGEAARTGGGEDEPGSRLGR
jgi:hypothetical protein